MRGRLIIALVVLTLSVPIAHATQYANPRAFVSRVGSDLRSMQTALEAYHFDHGAYPPSTGSPEWQVRDHWLTTPIAYLTAEFTDTFKSRRPVRVRFPILTLIGPLGLLVGLALTFGALFTAIHHFSKMATRSGKEGVRRYRDLLPVYAAWSGLGLIVLWLIVFPVGFFRPYHHRFIPNEHWEDRPQGFTYWTDGSALWILISPGPDGELDLTDPRPTIEGGQIDWDFLMRHAYDPTNGTLSRGDVWRVKSP